MSAFVSVYSFCGAITPREASPSFRTQKIKKNNTNKRRPRFLFDDEYAEVAREHAYNGTASDKQIKFLMKQEIIRKNQLNLAIIARNIKAKYRSISIRGAAKKQKGCEMRSSAKSGDGNKDPDPDPDPEPERQLALFDHTSRAYLLRIPQKAPQKQYPAEPRKFPAPIRENGPTGLRWDHASVQTWLFNHPPKIQRSLTEINKARIGRPPIVRQSGIGGAQ